MKLDPKDFLAVVLVCVIAAVMAVLFVMSMKTDRPRDPHLTICPEYIGIIGTPIPCRKD